MSFGRFFQARGHRREPVKIRYLRISINVSTVMVDEIIVDPVAANSLQSLGAPVDCASV